MCILEVVHFIHHSHGTLYDRVGAEGACSLSESHAELKNRLCIHKLQHTPVSALCSAMAEDGIVENRRAKT